MINRKELLTISEISKLTNISISALKYYEKIGLISPYHVDANTSYRYYSICQYEKIDTIVELRNLNIPLNDIKHFMKKRSIKKSLEALRKQKEINDSKIKELLLIKQLIEKKINFLESTSEFLYKEFKIREEKFGERKAITFKRNSQTPLDDAYTVLELENCLNERAYTFAHSCLGLFIPREEIMRRDFLNSAISFMLVDRDIPNHMNNTCLIPRGKYICLQHNGDMWNRAPALSKLLNYIEENGYRITGDALHIQLIDEMVTDNEADWLYDIQIPVA